MAIAVIVPLHSDATRFDADAVWSETLESAIDAVSQALGRELAGAAVQQWPELRQLYVDCVLLDATQLSTKPARFDKKFGQFNIGCTVDCTALAGQAVEVQTAAIFGVVCQAAAAGFSKRGLEALAASCERFGAQLEPAFVRQCVADAPDGSDGMASEPIPLDSDGRRRHVRDLQREPGELWLMLRPHEGKVDAPEVMARIEDFVADGQLGEATGSSVGSQGFDLSFEVDNLADVAGALAQFLRRELPRLDFVISDDYEPEMDEAGHA